MEEIRLKGVRAEARFRSDELKSGGFRQIMFSIIALSGEMKYGYQQFKSF